MSQVQKVMHTRNVDAVKGLHQNLRACSIVTLSSAVATDILIEKVLNHAECMLDQLQLSAGSQKLWSTCDDKALRQMPFQSDNNRVQAAIDIIRRLSFELSRMHHDASILKH